MIQKSACLLALHLCVMAPAIAQTTPTLSYSIEATHAHDITRFTQGLAIDKGRLIESAGGYGRSLLSSRALSGEGEDRVIDLPSRYFAEGVTASPYGLMMLSWREGVAWLFDDRLRAIRRYSYAGEGWGLTYGYGKYIMSDGSSRLQFRDAEDFSLRRTVTVQDGNEPVSSLNELEFAQGLVLANVWHSARVAVIDPASGQVRAWLDLSALRRGFKKPAGWNESEHVLNGIAYDSASDVFWITGKCWPVMYVIRIEGLAALARTEARGNDTDPAERTSAH